MMEKLEQSDVDKLVEMSDACARVRRQLARVIVGQQDVVEDLLIALLARGHCILEGVPGLAKTLLISTLAESLDLSFSRVQFTPDLMPSDITGTEILQEDRSTGERLFKFLPGPIFANIVLADEINRTPPKTQAALLEAMQERQATVGGTRYPMQDPFFVLATQNPIEQEGTYPLPEAQQDRFMFKILVDYPALAEEFMIAETTTAGASATVEHVLNGEQLLDYQNLVRRVPVAPYCIMYALKLVRATRVSRPDVPEFVKQWVSWGAGPRAVQNLLLGAKTRAALAGRSCVAIEDIAAVAHKVLRHRILTTYAADSEGITSEVVIDRLLEHIPAAESEHPVPEAVRAALSELA